VGPGYLSQPRRAEAGLVSSQRASAHLPGPGCPSASILHRPRREHFCTLYPRLTPSQPNTRAITFFAHLHEIRADGSSVSEVRLGVVRLDIAGSCLGARDGRGPEGSSGMMSAVLLISSLARCTGCGLPTDPGSASQPSGLPHGSGSPGGGCGARLASKRCLYSSIALRRSSNAAVSSSCVAACSEGSGPIV